MCMHFHLSALTFWGSLALMIQEVMTHLILYVTAMIPALLSGVWSNAITVVGVGSIVGVAYVMHVYRTV